MNQPEKLLANSQSTIPYHSVIVTYQSSQNGMWRGFVMPYDITYEAATRKEVVQVLNDMLDSYVDGLQRYGTPNHLVSLQLSDVEDKTKWDQISQDLMNNLLASKGVINGDGYYAEAKIPA